MTLLDHLIELRNRLLVSFCAFLFLFFLCFIKFTDDNQNLADIVYMFLQAPLASQILENGGRMIFTALHEGFFTQVKVAFFISLCVSLPIFLIQIWRFVAPGLYQNEKQAFLPFLLATPILFIAGAAMVYYIVIPLAWDFFLSFQVNSVDGSLPIELEPRISEYLSLIMKLIFAFGLCFELLFLCSCITCISDCFVLMDLSKASIEEILTFKPLRSICFSNLSGLFLINFISCIKKLFYLLLVRNLEKIIDTSYKAMIGNASKI